MTPADARSELVHALRLDAIGPDPGESQEKALPQAPSEWYLTGFLVPYQAKAEERQDPTSNEDVDQGGADGGTDDAEPHDKPSARRAFLPSSIGMGLAAFTLVLRGSGRGSSLRRHPTSSGQGRAALANHQAGRDRDAACIRRGDRLGPAGRRRVLRAAVGVSVAAAQERFLNGAACHGCLLIAEPSCERRNEFLDRALVVPTVDAAGAEFFRL